VLKSVVCLCAVASGVFHAPLAAQAQSSPAELAEPRFARVSGTELAYVESGRGVPVVLVHGAFADFRYWERQLAEGAASFRVVAYSRRDHHPNERNSDPALQTPDRDAADLVELIEALGIAPVHLVGHSNGGHTALVAALMRPELVRSLVLEEGGFIADHPASMQVLAETAPIVRSVLEYRAAGAREAATRRFIDFVSGDGYFASLPAAARQIMLDNEPAMGLRANPDLRCAAVESIELPVLLVLGERSPPRIRRLITGVQDCLRHEKTVTIPGASHGIHYEQPAAFNRVVFGFIAAH
jgi:pimeloyl-ACP methyl ester carboxylesterase